MFSQITGGSMRKIFLPMLVTAICLIAAAAQNARAQNAAAQEATAQNASAQNHEPPAVMGIIREAVKEGHSAAHEKVEADWSGAMRKHNVPYHDLALTSMTGPSEALFLLAFKSFAEVEQAGKEMQKPALRAEIDLLEARDGELRSTSRTMYAVYRKDMSYRPELVNIGKTRYVGVTAFRLKLGHMEEFAEGSKKFLGAHEKAGLKEPMVAYQVIAGAPDGLFLFMEPMESLKMIDEMPAHDKAVAEAMGNEEFQRMMNGAGDVFTSIEYSLFAVSPRMSYVSKETEDVDPAFWRPKMSPVKATKTNSTRAEKSGQ
jgi:hypothetical protein